MNTRILVIIDAVLGAAVLALVYLILTTGAEEPPPPPDVERSAADRPEVTIESNYIAQAYPSLGSRDIFGVPIPIPPPPPVLPDRPPPPPDLAQMVEGVEVWSVFGTEGEIKIGGGEAVALVEGGTVQLPDNRNRSETIEVEILDIDDYEFAVTFRLDWLQPGYVPDGTPAEQIEMIETISMFPEMEELPE